MARCRDRVLSIFGWFIVSLVLHPRKDSEYSSTLPDLCVDRRSFRILFTIFTLLRCYGRTITRINDSTCYEITLQFTFLLRLGFKVFYSIKDKRIDATANLRGALARRAPCCLPGHSCIARMVPRTKRVNPRNIDGEFFFQLLELVPLVFFPSRLLAEPRSIKTVSS